MFNPLSVRSDATYDNPRELPCGIEVVLVNGTPVVEGVLSTGATPGRALRHGRD
jgi:N-acyl-D-amino-acid deacylase